MRGLEEVVCGGGGSEEAVGGEICARDVGEGERSARERHVGEGERSVREMRERERNWRQRALCG